MSKVDETKSIWWIKVDENNKISILFRKIKIEEEL
jgi:hypothetical protein